MRCEAGRFNGPHSSAVEHFLGKEEVTGSSPVVGSKNFMSDDVVRRCVEKCGTNAVVTKPANVTLVHRMSGEADV